MGAVGNVADRQDRPAYVRFEREGVEDKEGSIKAGRFIAKDVDYALITPPYSRDVIKIKVSQWFANMEQEVRNDRLPAEWLEKYRESYQRFLNGQEVPPDGTPIKDWGVLSPAQKKTLIAMNVLTVEDLAGINAEGLSRVGMGSLDLKNKAIAWLQVHAERGPMTQQMAALQQQNVRQEQTIEQLKRQVQMLTSRFELQSRETNAPSTESILADDILPEAEPQIKRGPGRPRKVE